MRRQPSWILSNDTHISFNPVTFSFTPPSVIPRLEAASGLSIFSCGSIWLTLQPSDAQHHVQLQMELLRGAEQGVRLTRFDVLHHREQCALCKVWLARSESESLF
jgi:hypothetical protein